MNSTHVPEIELTADGSPTLRHALLGETYHSLRGALGESRHVYIEAGLRYVMNQRRQSVNSDITTAGDSLLSGSAEAGAVGGSKVSPLRIFEMGFGSGLNGWLTLQEAERTACPVEYVSIEQYPVDRKTIQQLDYAADPQFVAMHQAPWNAEVRLTQYFTLKNHQRYFFSCYWQKMYYIRCLNMYRYWGCSGFDGHGSILTACRG